PMLTSGEDNTIPVYDFDTIETVASSGVITDEGSAMELINLQLDPSPLLSSLTLRLQPRLTDILVEHTESLSVNPESSVSTVVHAIRIDAAVLGAAVSLPDQEQQLQKNIEAGIQRLMVTQQFDGDWGWYAGMPSDPLITTQALID